MTRSAGPQWLLLTSGRRLTRPRASAGLLCLLSAPQCDGVLPQEELPDGTKPKPSQRWSHYQLWWQTVMTAMTPELRRMGWSNLKCAVWAGGGLAVSCAWWGPRLLLLLQCSTCSTPATAVAAGGAACSTLPSVLSSGLLC